MVWTVTKKRINIDNLLHIFQNFGRALELAFHLSHRHIVTYVTCLTIYYKITVYIESLKVTIMK